MHWSKTTWGGSPLCERKHKTISITRQDVMVDDRGLGPRRIESG